MKGKILTSTMGATLLLLATAVLTLAWPDQPPEKVSISGPGIEGQVEVRDAPALAIFRLGHLEDFKTYVPAPTQVGTGYKIVRFFYGGDFDFARLTYYPNPSGGRGYLYWEDGPHLQGDHTPYDEQWLYVTASGESQLRTLLNQLGAKVDGATPAESSANSVSADANAPSTTNVLPSAESASTTNASKPKTVMSIPSALLVGAGLLAAVGALVLWRARRTQATH